MQPFNIWLRAKAAKILFENRCRKRNLQAGVLQGIVNRGERSKNRLTRSVKFCKFTVRDFVNRYAQKLILKRTINEKHMSTENQSELLEDPFFMILLFDNWAALARVEGEKNQFRLSECLDVSKETALLRFFKPDPKWDPPPYVKRWVMTIL